MNNAALFKSRAYILPEDKFSDTKLAEACLNKLDIEFKTIHYYFTHDRYDAYLVEKGGTRFLLKISLEKNCEIFKKELDFCSNVANPIWAVSGNIKIGDSISYFLQDCSGYLPLEVFGRQEIINQWSVFIDDYKQKICNTPSEVSISELFKEIDSLEDINSWLSEDAIESLKSHSDYESFFDLWSNLISYNKESRSGDFKSELTCNGNISLKNLFLGPEGFSFIENHTHFKGNPLLDFYDIVLNFGFSNHWEIKTIKNFTKVFNLEASSKDCKDFSTSKHLINLIMQYVKEVYQYDSYRKVDILQISQSFISNFDRYKSIPIFNKHKDFITNTLTESILNT